MPEQNALILIVDDDTEMLQFLSRLMKTEGFRALEARDGETAQKLLDSETPDLMILDLRIRDMEGMEILRRAKDLNRNLPIIVITGNRDTHEAVKAIKAGACEHFATPFESSDLARAVRQALSEGIRRGKPGEFPRKFEEKNSLEESMGPSDSVRRITSEVNRVAGSDFAVVIIGETGSGKELIARAIHEVSFRAKAPFIAVDCGAIPETLLESELFGHEKGSFTGADAQKRGKFELAEGGTLFLDEISNMPLGSQVKLLRVLQEKKIYRVGGTKPIDINVRLLVASNRDLQELSESGSFRKDLFYRLNEFSIVIPPLRERKEDMPYLAKRFLDTANLELRKHVKGFSESAIKVLFDYSWPGNVRQLRSVIRRATLLADDMISDKQLDLKKETMPDLTFAPKVEGTPWRGLSLKEIVEESTVAVEREVLTRVLRETGGNKARAARLLKIDYKTIHLKLKKLGLWEARLTTGEQDADLESEPSESAEPFDPTLESRTSAVGVDAPQKWEQKRLRSAA